MLPAESFLLSLHPFQILVTCKWAIVEIGGNMESVKHIAHFLFTGFGCSSLQYSSTQVLSTFFQLPHFSVPAVSSPCLILFKPYPPNLPHFLSIQGPYVLSMAPGFFGFYAHTGALIALEDEGLLERVRFTGFRHSGIIV